MVSLKVGWPGQGDVVDVRVADLGLVGLAMLYRMDRISPAVYLQILRGFRCAAVVH